MQCVILAAGKGTRLQPITNTIPKPLVPVCGKPVLDYIVEALPSVIDELILVVGYRGEQIRNHCGEVFHGRKVQYVKQANFAGGTGDALLCAKELITGKFLFMYADDIHGADALEKVTQEEHAMLGMYSDTPELFGVLVKNPDGTLKEIVEKPAVPPSNLINIGGFMVDKTILDFVPDKSQHQGEVYVTDMLTEYAKVHPVKIIEQDYWLPIGYHEHIVQAEQMLCPESVDLKG